MSTCSKCECRVDGMDGKKYCYRPEFNEPSKYFTTTGRPIIDYPKTPAWCPRNKNEGLWIAVKWTKKIISQIKSGLNK